MRLFKGYVLLQELYEKAQVSNSLFQQLSGVKIEKMGHTRVIKTDSLPLNYKKIAQKCTDLEYYYTYTALNKELGLREDKLHYLSRKNIKKFKYKKIGGHKFFKFSEAFVNFVSKGFVPFLIDESSKEYADYQIDMQGLKIGFY